MNTLTRDFGGFAPQALQEALGSAYYPRLRALAIRLQQQLLSYYQVAVQRRALAELSDEQLADVGITRSQAREESAKPFWR
ncbi:MAG: DUF1127 domain-containing protein [Gammaproteobacteria bacterium]|nr:DUF1127 domain-containing protein [Gammaproteobacteria bacterium]